MNNEDFDKRISNRWNRHGKGKGNVWTGVFFLIIGVLLTARTAGTNFPDWFFSWPMMLIALGLFIGLRQGFRHGTWWILIIIGSIFLADNVIDHEYFYLRPYFWPIMFMIIGIYIILGPKGATWRKNRFADTDDTLLSSDDRNLPFAGTSTNTGFNNAFADGNDVIDITAIFSGVKKNVLSKNFKGGDIVAIMGGTELNLTKADFTGRVILDSFTMFGGLKLFVPPDWDVQSQVVAIFGGVDDKRPPAQHDPSKVILLNGTCIFGGIEIRSF